jgi:hypothetical protein
MRSLSPGLRGTSYPGCAIGCGLNPEGVGSSVARLVVNPTAWRRERIGRGGEPTLTGLVGIPMPEPRVARASQPWAEGSNPFGIAQGVRTPGQIENLRYACGLPLVRHLRIHKQTTSGTLRLDPSDFGFRPSLGLRTSDLRPSVHGTTPFLVNSSATAFKAWCSR